MDIIWAYNFIPYLALFMSKSIPVLIQRSGLVAIAVTESSALPCNAKQG